MAENMSDNSQQPRWWQQLLEGGYMSNRPHRGEVLEATVLSKSQHDLIVELEGKRDGVVPQRDLEMVDEEIVAQISEGDTIPVRVRKVPLNQSGIIVSLNQGLAHKDWLDARQLMESEEVVGVDVTGVNRGGVLVAYGNLTGFVPNSHLSSVPRGLRGNQLRERKEQLVGQKLYVVAIEVVPRRQRLVFSERLAQSKRRHELLEELHEGAVRTGIVRTLVDFGAFVDLGGIDGLIHISELAWEFVEHPRDILSVGDEVEVYVLDVDRERGRIALSRKRLLPEDPWGEPAATREEEEPAPEIEAAETDTPEEDEEEKKEEEETGAAEGET